MNTLHLLPVSPASQPRLPIGRHLVDAGAIASDDLIHALDMQRHIDAPLGEILISEGLLDRDDLLQALARQHGADFADLEAEPPAMGLKDHIPLVLALRHAAVPWKRVAGSLLVATSRPDRFDALRAAMGPQAGTLLPVVADHRQIQTHLNRTHGRALARQAARRVPEAESCRIWDIETGYRRNVAIAIGLVCLMFLILTPLWFLTGVMLFAVATLAMTTALKASAFIAQITRPVPQQTAALPAPAPPFRLPKVSILVPLLQEKEIAGALIQRLSRLTYPKSQLNVILVLEAGDQITRDTLAETRLPDWMSVVEVPEADKLTTKPRALNYALDFCDGSIIGVWDAEDAPEPDQIERIVSRFHEVPKNVVCLQGILDYYNPRANWLSRCFTIEYASWWRVILPGAARLGLVLPLGGTTLFMKRDVLEKLGGWDAHNVTEDADLGLRLARHGYRTELVTTVTHEEANCRLWPWVRQRSRWLKGFLITWCVHMRQPGRLLRELGLWRFLGIQTMFFATFCQFALTPILWSFWLASFALPHPVSLTLGTPVLWTMAGLFIFSETLNLALSMTAVSGKEHRFLMGWVFTMPVYFFLGSLAAAKALYEFVLTPFYWDKTEHGVTPDPDEEMFPSFSTVREKP